GPVFFKQERVGKNNKSFVLYKFRSMKPLKDEQEETFEPGVTTRVTRFGKLLRKTKLDELPQLINVLIGDMAIVGPRPEVKKWVDAYPERWKRILAVEPGITDNASIKFRNEERILADSSQPELTYKYDMLPAKLDMYEEYIRTRSFSGDIKIIVKTIFAIVRN
ncbi:MAG: sugar transferase, partial [Bacteroidales bacterium]|nr:sugar transferase [Bacteroidales bacterium]